MAFIDEFRSAMITSGEKQVSHTDITKVAYVPNEDQREVMLAAGHEPVNHHEVRLIGIVVAGTEETLPTTYYGSERTGSGRRDEVRMGRGLVNWLSEGDTLLLGTDGATVFAVKINDPPEREPEDDEEKEAVVGDEDAAEDSRTGRIYTRLTLERLLAKANDAGEKVKRRSISSKVFERNPAVREYARRRSGCKCETPGCSWEGFLKTNGEAYIEVHHVIGLGDDGRDAIDNVAAVCPSCHRKAHYGADKKAFATALLKAVLEENRLYREEQDS